MEPTSHRLYLAAVFCCEQASVWQQTVLRQDARAVLSMGNAGATAGLATQSTSGPQGLLRNICAPSINCEVLK
jgi:hypothetical protein